MKKTITFILVAFSMLISYSAGSQNNKTDDEKLQIYYFHSEHRCATCLAIEKETRALIDQLEPDEKQQLKLHVLNLDDQNNKELVDKYEIWGSALLLVKPKAGQQEEIVVLTQDGFSYARTQSAKFRGILKENLEKMLHN